jgi:DNA polymerase-3 subunit delta
MATKVSDFSAKQRQLNEDIKAGNFSPCYLIYGDEAYLRYQNRDKLLTALGVNDSSMNFNKYEGIGCIPGEIIDMAETMPFLAQRRVILLEDSGFFKNGSPELSEYLKNQAQSCILIFVEKEVDRRKDIYKALSKTGFEIECTTQTDDSLRTWIAMKFRNEGKSISPRALAFFLDRVGTDMSNIASEIEKLSSYCLDRSEVREEDIEAVCANYLTGRIFAMTDAIADRDQKRAIELYYDLLALKEPSAKILALITRQFNLMLQIKEMADNRRSNSEIGSALKLQPFLVPKYLKWARGYSYEQLKAALDLCASNDEAVKSGKLDYVICVEMVIIGCTGPGISA